MVTQNRPTMITLLAVGVSIAGLLDLLVGLLLLIGGSLSGILVLVFTFVDLALAYGLWKLNPWAWELCVGWAAVGVLVSPPAICSSGSIWPAFAGILNLILLFYFFQPTITDAFGWSTYGPEKQNLPAPGSFNSQSRQYGGSTPSDCGQSHHC